MTRSSAHALAVARPVIQGLTVLNLIYAAGLAALLIWSFFIQGWPDRPLVLAYEDLQWVTSDTRDFLDAFAHETPPSTLALLTYRSDYDAGWLMDRGYVEVRLDGLAPPITFTPKDHEGGGYLAIYQVKGNEWVPVTDWAQGYRDEVMQLLRKTNGP